MRFASKGADLGCFFLLTMVALLPLLSKGLVSNLLLIKGALLGSAAN